MVPRLPTALLAAFCGVVFSPAAVQAADLESALAGQANLTTFRGLVKVRIPFKSRPMPKPARLTKHRTTPNFLQTYQRM